MYKQHISCLISYFIIMKCKYRWERRLLWTSLS